MFSWTITRGSAAVAAFAAQVLVGLGNVWKRRPTRWLKGLDGKRNFRYGVYVHEDLAHMVSDCVCVSVCVALQGLIYRGSLNKISYRPTPWR